MSQPETTALTELQEMNDRLMAVETRLMQQTEALNSLGENVQWVIDNAKGIFEMFHSPAFRQMLPMMGGHGGGPGTPDGA